MHMKLQTNVLLCEEIKNDLIKVTLSGVSDIIRCKRGSEVHRTLVLPYAYLMDQDDPRTLHISVYLRYLADEEGNPVNSVALLDTKVLELHTHDLPAMLPTMLEKLMHEEGDVAVRTGQFAIDFRVTFPGSGIYQIEAFNDFFPVQSIEYAVGLKQFRVLCRE